MGVKACAYKAGDKVALINRDGKLEHGIVERDPWAIAFSRDLKTGEETPRWNIEVRGEGYIYTLHEEDLLPLGDERKT